MKYFITSLLILVVAVMVSCNNGKQQETQATSSTDTTTKTSSVDTSLKLPEGFSASVFADKLGSARHIAVNTNGDIFVRLGGMKNGHGTVRLRDTNNDGVADSISGFGNFGGTGITIKNGYLYASSDNDVYRYKLGQDGTPDTASVEMIITGLINKGEHSAKAITLDDSGHVYVNIGAPSNSCQVEDRKKGSPGMKPCPILDSAGGIWQFKADKANQHYADGIRYCTGIRNIVALYWNSQANYLYAVQHVCGSAWT
jgi:glucose/arabinose dehydrogenase